MKQSARFLCAMLAFSVVACSVVVGSGRSEGSSSGPSPAAAVAGTPRVEIAFLNHSPVLTALKDVDKLLASYGDKITVIRYDLETDEGAAFAKGKRLAGHVPLAIFINGAMEVKLNDRTVKFYSFPEGKGTFMVASGSWTVEDLRQTLDQAVSRGQ
jgi:hypothetical protein